MVQDWRSTANALGFALLTLLRIVECSLPGSFADADAFKTNVQTRRVHHREHAREAFIFLADQPARRVFIFHDAGWRGVDADFFFEADTFDAILVAEAAICSDDPLRDDEERDASRAFWRIRQARQYQVDNILGDVVIAPSDIDFLSRNRIRAVTVRDCFGF